MSYFSSFDKDAQKLVSSGIVIFWDYFVLKRVRACGGLMMLKHAFKEVHHHSNRGGSYEPLCWRIQTPHPKGNLTISNAGDLPIRFPNFPHPPKFLMRMSLAARRERWIHAR
jgi:hypothetical protein